MSAKDRSAGKSGGRIDLRSQPVGYGRPPIARRFKPGKSGNPKGRPTGSKNMKALIREAMTASIPMQEGEKVRRVSRLEGVVLRQIQSALKGNDKSAMAVVKMALQLGFLEDAEGNHSENDISEQEKQILNELIARSLKD